MNHRELLDTKREYPAHQATWEDRKVAWGESCWSVMPWEEEAGWHRQGLCQNLENQRHRQRTASVETR